MAAVQAAMKVCGLQTGRRFAKALELLHLQYEHVETIAEELYHKFLKNQQCKEKKQTKAKVDFECWARLDDFLMKFRIKRDQREEYNLRKATQH